MSSGSNTGRGKVMISDIVFRENFVYSISGLQILSTQRAVTILIGRTAAATRLFLKSAVREPGGMAGFSGRQYKCCGSRNVLSGTNRKR